MKVISLLQPWASLVILNAKQWETRSWGTTHRGLLGIHASAKKPSRREKAMFEQDSNFKKFISDTDLLPYGALIGKTTLTEVYDTTWVLQNRELFPEYNWQNEFAFDDFSPNRFAWQLKNITPLKHFLPMKGTLGLWEYNGII